MMPARRGDPSDPVAREERPQRTCSPLNLNTIVKEVVGLLHSDALIRGIVILHELEADLPKILGDRIQLQQVAAQPPVERFRCDERWSVT